MYVVKDGIGCSTYVNLRSGAWSMDTRKTTHPTAGLKATSPALPKSSADRPPDPPIALPSDLATSLRYLEDSELQRLRTAVEAEIDRRKQSSSTGGAKKASPPRTSGPISPSMEAAKIAEIPEGKVNLIRA